MTFTSGEESADPAFFAKVRKVRKRFAQFCEHSGIENAGFIRDRPDVIELLTEAGHRMSCRRPWDTLAIHANGDAQPCMSWTRPPFGNLAQQTFAEIWTGKELDALRQEFERIEPGVDCQHCAIKKTVPVETYDDFFFRKISKTLPIQTPRPVSLDHREDS